MCPKCGALERHRLIKTFFAEQTDILDGKPRKMLHVAPEAALEQFFDEVTKLDRITTDLFDPRVKLKADLTALPLETGTFDVVYCSHVLEHVPDDRKAMSELRRVLRSSGFGIVMVPITAKETFEDPSVTDPDERLRLFGQDDHVRRYGPDFVERLRESGFDVTEFSAVSVLGDRMKQYAVPNGEHPIFLCRPR